MMKQTFFSEEKVMVLEPMAAAANRDIITEFSVTTDSVVATVTLKFKSGTKRVRVNWGNGKSTVLRLDRIMSPLNSGPVIMLPDGRFEFRHIFESPDDGSSFSTIILVKADNSSNDDIRIQQVSFVPRYQVHFADVFFRLLEPGDFHELTSEWRISMSARYSQLGQVSEPLGPNRAWRRTIPESGVNTPPTPWFKLNGSGRGHSLIKDERINVVFTFTETDLIWNNEFHFYITLDVTKATDGFYVTDSTDSIEIRYYQQIELIKPWPANDDWVVLEN